MRVLPAIVRTTLLVALAFSFVAGAAEPKPPAEPPRKFLHTDIPAWQRVLATKITVNLQGATISEAVGAISHRSQASMILVLESSSRTTPARPLPKTTITWQVHRIPLRTVLYQISRDTGLTVDWDYVGVGKFPFAIKIWNP